MDRVFRVQVNPSMTFLLSIFVSDDDARPEFILIEPFQSASTTFDRDEPPHSIDRLGAVVALYLVR